MNYYNEIDPYAAQWLRNLIAAGHIAPGVVDERSIADVQPDDIAGFAQCHFFAGIGGWSYALRLAGWPDDRPVWTGSCPCQPFSVAGKQRGTDDARHLWPHWFRLIRECRPSVIFGEQVDAAIRAGWLDIVLADLESCGYSAGAAILPAGAVGAPHKRDRLWFVADAYRCGFNGGRLYLFGGESRTDPLGDSIKPGLEGHGVGHQTAGERGFEIRSVAETGESGGLADADSERWRQAGRDAAGHREAGSNGPGNRDGDGGSHGITARVDASAPTSPAHVHWQSSDWLFCRDGRWRPVEPGSSPLAHGISNRVGRLRAYGNAIVPQVAAEFVRACS